ncbi:MAG: amino acid transporter [Nocardioides sp.]|nr:amino acid transporter [Nocardioides sp.]
MLSSTTAGLLTGLTLIIAIGVQNAFVLRQGLAREHVGLVVAICAVADIVLIAGGVAGIGAIIENAGWAVTVVRWVGVAFLIWYGVSALLRARRTESLHAATAATTSRSRIAGRTLALTLLNPHVYLDTVLLLGSIAAHQGSTGRWWFALGASVASVTWFTGLGYGARAASRLFARPRAWQVLDVLIAITMLAIAATLARGA